MNSRLIDAAGCIHQALDPGAASAARIVSLVPSITELLCDLGLSRLLVGRTGFCIHPAPIVSGIAKIGGTKDVNIEKIRRLAATHLIVNIDENEKPTVDRLAGFIPNIIVTHPQAPRDNPDLYRLLGGIFGATEQAESLCHKFEAACADLQQAAPHRPKTVLYCIWKDPWMTVAPNTYIARMMAMIGWCQWHDGSTEAEHGSARYPQFQWQASLLDAIDEILLSSEPYRFSAEQVAELAEQTGKPVRLVDGEMFSWYGSRAIAGLRYLKDLKQD